MADAGQPAGDGRRRGKRNRSRQGGRRKRSKGRGNRPQTQERYLPEPLRDDTSILGSRTLRPTERRAPQDNGPPDAFALFCSYHLGITAEDGYQKPSADEVARRFGIDHSALQSMLSQHGLDQETLRRSRFDLEGAKLDIRVAPAGISRTEIARDLFEDLLEAQRALSSD